MSLPTNWATSSIEELFKTAGGGTPSTAKAEYWSGSIPWISSADINEDHQISVRRFITQAAVKDSATNVVPATSVIVVTRVGLGKVAIAPQSMCFSQDSQALIFSSKYFNPKFVLLYMSTAVKVFKHIGRGTTINGVTKKQLLELEFLLPPRNEQDRIVAEIEKQFTRLDDAVAALKRVQANLKRYRASVLKAACEGRLVPTEAELARKEGRTFEPATELLKRILAERRAKWEADQLQKMIAAGKPPKNGEWKRRYKEPVPALPSNLPQIPEGWAWATIEQLTTASDGLVTGPFGTLISKADHLSEGVPVCGIPNITERGFVPGDWFHVSSAKANDLQRYFILSGDIVVSRSGTVGEACAVDFQTEPLLMSTNLMRLRSVWPAQLGRWMVVNFKGNATISSQIGSLCKGSTRPFLNLEILSQLVVALPPTAERERILVEIEKSDSSMENVNNSFQAQLFRSQALRRALLGQAFSGKLVPQDSNDEPASVLLERIRAERAALATNNGNQKAIPEAGTTNGQRRRRVARLAHRASGGKGAGK